METKIFLNLSVKELHKSMQFFTNWVSRSILNLQMTKQLV
jgi:predicted lactoylglutathione lyase